MSERQTLLEAWQTRLETTTYPVALGTVEALGANDPKQALLLTVGDDLVKVQGGKLFVTLPITIYALADADLDQPWVAVEAMLAAIKTAVETADHRLGETVKRAIERGPTRTIPREPGSTVVGAGITYYSPYEETWGQP